MSVRYSGEWKIFHYSAPEAVQHGCFIKSCFDVETPQERNCNGVSFLPELIKMLAMTIICKIFSINLHQIFAET